MKSATVIAANRFGLGARPGELTRIDPDPHGWLSAQITAPSAAPAVLDALPHSDAVLVEVLELRRAQREARRNDEDFAERYGRVVREHYARQALARYQAAAATEQPFHERLVHFWSNHFAVSADKQPIPAIAGLYENEAIRPHVAGRFSDLLMSAIRHPAMIVYLDNQRSIGPNSTLGRRANRRRSQQSFGLNENLAREILELHTLGVDGGYTQADVTAFARVITGWSVGGTAENGRFAAGEPGRFEFRDNIHEPGEHRVMGKAYAAGGVEQGEAVLRDLAVHPSTARFLATKLARHFVADEPPAAVVDRLANAYLDSGGELSTVYTALIESPEAWQQLAAKYKTPHDLVVSAFRAFDHVPDDGRRVVGSLDILGQVPFRPGSPAGWPDTAEQWGGADALYKRIEWADTVARIAGPRVNPAELGLAVLGPALTSATRKAVSRAESSAQGLTLLLASPDFQRR